MTAQNLKLRVPVPFPATVAGAGGIAVTKENGLWTIKPDFGALASVAAANVADPSLKQIWIRDSIADEYNVLTLAGLGDALYKATSTTSLLIGVGSAAFATQANKDFSVGMFVLATSDANPANYMLGQVTSYANGSLVLNVTVFGGSGTKADWTLRAATAPAAGAGYAATSASGLATAGTGSKAFAVALGLAYSAGARIRATSAGTGEWMEGVVSSYVGTTLTVTMDKNSGAGIHADWNINLAGQPGTDGALVGSTGAADNRLLRSDGTGGATVQASAITVDDSGNVSGVGTIASGAMTATVDDATNNGVTRPVVVKHTTSGSPAIGIGAGIRFDVETATAENIEQAGAIDIVATDITGATEDFDLVVKLMAAGAAIAEVFRVSSTGVATLLGNAAKVLLNAAGGVNLTGGFTATSFGNGTVSTGTLTPDPLNGNVQDYTNNGAHTLAPPSSNCSIVLDQTNGASAGTVTRSGFTKVTGDTLTTTNGNKFRHFITKGVAGSHCHSQAMQ